MAPVSEHASNNQALWTALATLFDIDLPITSELLALLQQERKALETRQYQAFQQLISKKQQLLLKLEKNAEQRQQLLQAAGFTDETSTLNAADHHAPIVATAWRKLGAQWSHCQELNEVNDRIAKRTRLVVGQILDLMRGQNSKDKLYTRKGNAHSTNSGRTITSA
ncbi:MAG: flagella synthesis protein FlgN [Oceanicoccus sp.]|jgi:flagella synthesis protein FlgN